MTRRSEKQPWGKFYWSDWLSDPKLKLCSLSAQGLWIRMLCIAAEANPVGYVVLEGNALGPTELAAECGKSLREVTAALAELQRWGVFSTDRRGRIYSRRMIKDVRKAKVARENGKTGGNPNLGNSSGNRSWDKRVDKPQSPEARTRTRRTPRAPQGGTVEIPDWKGPEDIRRLVVGILGPDGAGYLLSFTWREVPEPKAIVTSSPTMFAKLKPCEGALSDRGWLLLLEKRATA